MATYWLSFRLNDDSTYDERYGSLIETIREQAISWWVDTTAFIVFDSQLKIDGIAGSISKVINNSTDLVILGMPDYKSARLIGETEDEDIFKLISFIKKA